MSLRINTNVAALDAYNNLAVNQNKLTSAFEQLSSGMRINKAADDAAGMSISQGLTSQINGLAQSVQNAQDGVNVAQIADGALNTASQILQRMRTLAVQASNTGSQDSAATAAAQSEITSLNTQLDNISSQTAFGGIKLLDGTYTAKVFQVGSNAGDTITLSLTKSDSTTLGTNGINVTTGASAAITTIDTALATVSANRASIGATQNQLNYTVSNLNTAIQNVTASRSNITDADLAAQVTAMTQSQILTQAATSVLAQANSAPQAILKLLQ